MSFTASPGSDAPDLITGKLAALHFYQLSMPTPKPPADAFDAARAKQGQALFAGKARCASCHERAGTTTIQLSEQEKADLIEFLKSI